MKKLICVLLVLCMTLSFLPALAAEETSPLATPFQNGDVIALFGDSITHNSLYLRYLYMYYAVTFPDAEFEIVNFGYAGDTTVQLLDKMDRDLALRPDINKAYIMIGANDCNAELAEGFEDRLTKIVQKLKAASNIKEIVLMTPTHPEPIGSKRYNFMVENVKAVRKVAKSFNLPVAEVHNTLLDASNALKADDPQATFLPDSLHPDAGGNMLILQAILQAQGLVPLTGKNLPIITVDLSANTVTDCKNATATAVTQTGNTWEFSYTADRLPFPIMGGFDKADKYADFGDFLGIHDLLQFTGLTGSTYTLAIDGETVGDYTAAQLLRGIDLAALDGSPIQNRSKLVRRKAEMLGIANGNYIQSHVSQYGVLGLKELNTPVEELEKLIKEAVASGKIEQTTADTLLNGAKNKTANHEKLLALTKETLALAKDRTFKVTLTQKATGAPAKTFADVETHWGKPYILPLTQQGIINGKGTGFEPDGQITRAEFMTLTLKVGAITAASGKSYSDVAADAWFSNTVATAKAQNLIPASMVSDGNFYPDRNITREEMTAVLTALYESQKPAAKGAKIDHFTDFASFSDWATAPISKAVALGLVAGNPDGSFNAKGNATRAEAAVIMSRLQKLL